MAVGSAGFHHPAVRAARLLHHKKHRHARRRFLIEGNLLVAAALESRGVEQIFVSQDEPVAEELQRLAAAAAPMLKVDRRTLESLSQTNTPQGIVAVVAFLHHQVDELPGLLPAGGAALALVLPNLADPGNAGTLIRSAEAFAAGAVCFGPHSVEPYNDKVVRASMGSLFRIPIVRYDDWAALLAAARSARLALVGADAGGIDVRGVTLPDRIALVIGQERHGLAEIPRSDMECVVAIPQRKGVESLNAAVAGSLLLYELGRTNGLLGPPRSENG